MRNKAEATGRMVIGVRCVARLHSPMARCSQISPWGERFCMGRTSRLREFLRMAGDEISRNKYGMVIGIEALRKAESNIVNTSAEACQLAVQTNHPKIRIIVDFFHLANEREDPAILRRVKDYIVHLHFSDPSRGRAFPRIESRHAADPAFFSYLREIGYQGRMSLEATTSDFQTDRSEERRVGKEC